VIPICAQAKYDIICAEIAEKMSCD
jgi:hypothetical protein